MNRAHYRIVQTELTEREHELMLALIAGYTQTEFGKANNLARQTVGEYALRIRDKLNARTMVQAAIIYYGLKPTKNPARGGAF